jgi:hypothetical protein
MPRIVIPASLRSDFIHIAPESTIHIVGIRTIPVTNRERWT